MLYSFRHLAVSTSASNKVPKTSPSGRSFLSLPHNDSMQPFSRGRWGNSTRDK
jgi:hypothetical protein